MNDQINDTLHDQINDTMHDRINDTTHDQIHDTLNAESLEHALETATDSLSVRRVFGDPIYSGGVTIIPTARIAGGGGGGGGTDKVHGAKGMGVGFGSASRPLGMYVVDGKTVSWKPSTDRNLVLLVSAGIAALTISTIRLAIKTYSQ
jgi:uncharacterized spore protein YtfJ